MQWLEAVEDKILTEVETSPEVRKYQDFGTISGPEVDVVTKSRSNIEFVNGVVLNEIAWKIVSGRARTNIYFQTGIRGKYFEIGNKPCAYTNPPFFNVIYNFTLTSIVKTNKEVSHLDLRGYEKLFTRPMTAKNMSLR